MKDHMNNTQDDIFGRIIVMNSFWSILFIITIIFVGYRNMQLGLIFLLVMTLIFIIYLDDQVNHNENIEMLE
jgi:hypothetical protein